MSKLSEQMRERSRVIDSTAHICCTTGGCVKCLLEFGGLQLAEAETRLSALVAGLRVILDDPMVCSGDEWSDAIDALLAAHGFGDEQAALRGQDEPEGGGPAKL